MASGILLAGDVAVEFHRVNSWRTWSSATDLVADVDTYMADHGLAKSSIDGLAIAEEVLRLQRRDIAEQRDQIASPEQAAWQNDQMQGTSATSYQAELDLANRVAAMSAGEFAAERSRLGLQKNVLDFLGGNA